MAGPYYVDPAAAGSNNGSSWTNAWTSIQSAFDTATAGEIVYCRGTQTLSATLDIDTNSGTNAAGWIKFIGCNASGNIDGTRFTINGNAGAYSGITVATRAMYWLENIRITNCGNSTSYSGINSGGSASNGWVFINVSLDNNAGYGVLAQRFNNSIWYRCIAYSNGLDGFYYTPSGWWFFCRSYGNSGSGWNYAYYTYSLIGCIAYDNGDDGFEAVQSTALFNCVSDSNTDDGITVVANVTQASAILIGNRITNHSGAGNIGLELGSDPIFMAYNLMDNNTDNIANSSLAQSISVENTTTDSNEYYNEGTGEAEGTLQGYTSDSDYNLSSSADLRRDPITIPLT